MCTAPAAGASDASPALMIARRDTNARAAALRARFEAAGAEAVTSRLVFTGDKFDTFTRISSEEGCDAVLIPGPIDHLRRLLVPIRGLHNARHIIPFIADLVEGSGGTTDVTLLHVLEEGEAEAGAQEDILGPVVEQLAAYGVDTELVERRVVATDDPADTIVDEAGHYDLVVLGETQPSVRSILFGTIPEQIVRAVDVPVVVVRHEEEEVGVAERATRLDEA